MVSSPLSSQGSETGWNSISFDGVYESLVVERIESPTVMFERTMDSSSRIVRVQM